jgi:ATP-dependent exoDNAse (exonuclease V) alpha subunit
VRYIIFGALLFAILLGMTQKEALAILKTGKNVFITGPAGSGKTFVVNEYIKYLRQHKIPVGITASTGIAATHMGGVTIHSWSGIGVRDDLAESDIEDIAEKSYIRNRIEETKVLIIDEVSMLHHFRLNLVERVLRFIKKNEDPFGGIQVVLCGDFFQLPPISRQGEQPSQFMYTADSWRNGDFTICYLSENYRQTDDVSLSILNEIRAGDVSDESREHLKSRHNVRSLNGIEPTRLYTHNINVDTVNDQELSKIDNPECIYEMKTKGRPPLIEALKKSCLAPESLRLRKGARVMCVKNNFEQGYVNGTLGVVVSCGHGVPPIILTASTRDHPNGRKLTIEEATWVIEDEGKKLAEITQYPLRLAWAITVHKSQGMSLDAIEVDLSRSFEPGMGYVALSRVRTLAGLTILGMNEMAFQVHPEVLEHDAELRSLSEQSEIDLTQMNEDDLANAHAKFLARSAPMHKISDKVSTFDITESLLQKKKSLKEIAKERDMVIETIISHIETLVEEGSAVDISYLKKEIPHIRLKKIEKALEEVFEAQTGDAEGKAPLLSPVKSKVGANVSFKDIRLARVLLGYMKKKIPLD